MEKPIPTIMVSALTTGNSHEGTGLGAFDFIPKTEQFQYRYHQPLQYPYPKIKAIAQIEPKIPSYDIKPISPGKDKISKDLKSKF